MCEFFDDLKIGLEQDIAIEMGKATVVEIKGMLAETYRAMEVAGSDDKEYHGGEEDA